MPTNFETKIRIPDINTFESLAKSFGAVFSDILEQTDTYFKTGYGKLKLREFSNKPAELIYYDRQGEEFWQSDYIVAGINDSKNLKKIFSFLFETLIIVKKRRILYLFQNARIHLDKVDELGMFLEFEVIVRDGDEQAKTLLNKLHEYFKIEEKDIVRNSYSDLLQKKTTT